MTPTLLSFDVFGTLVDSRAGSRDAFASILRAANATHIDPLDFQDQWELANVRRYAGPYRSYKTICRESLVETFGRFGVSGDADAIGIYFDAYPGFRRFPDVDPVLDRLAEDTASRAARKSAKPVTPR